MKLTEKINSITNNLCFPNSLKDELPPKLKHFMTFKWAVCTALNSPNWGVNRKLQRINQGSPKTSDLKFLFGAILAWRFFYLKGGWLTTDNFNLISLETRVIIDKNQPNHKENIPLIHNLSPKYHTNHVLISGYKLNWGDYKFDLNISICFTYHMEFYNLNLVKLWATSKLLIVFNVL